MDALKRMNGNPALTLIGSSHPGTSYAGILQWAGVRATETGFYAVPIGDGKLQPAQRLEDSYDFNVGLLTTQLRYRWEIAPLTDFFFGLQSR